MGNCMACHSQLKKQTRCPLIEGKDIEVDALVPVEKITSASSKHYIMVHRILQHGEVYHFAPFMMQSGMPLVSRRTTDNKKLKTRNVKIMVTAEQLELLLSGSKNFQSKSRVARFRESSGMRRCRRWLPSLPTIQEVQNY